MNHWHRRAHRDRPHCYTRCRRPPATGPAAPHGGKGARQRGVQLVAANTTDAPTHYIHGGSTYIAHRRDLAHLIDGEDNRLIRGPAGPASASARIQYRHCRRRSGGGPHQGRETAGTGFQDNRDHSCQQEYRWLDRRGHSQSDAAAEAQACPVMPARSGMQPRRLPAAFWPAGTLSRWLPFAARRRRLLVVAEVVSAWSLSRCSTVTAILSRMLHDLHAARLVALRHEPGKHQTQPA